MACKNHPDRDSVAQCVECGAELCNECEKTGPDGKSYCAEHVPAAAEAQAGAAAAPVTPPATPPPATPAATPPATSPPPTPAPTAPAAPPAPVAAGSSDSSNRVLAALGYPIWIIALIVILTDMKRDAYMRFHGWNGLFWGIAYVVALIALGILSQLPGIGLLFGLLTGLVGLVWFILSIVFAVKAYNGQEVNIPVITEMARKQANAQRV